MSEAFLSVQPHTVRQFDKPPASDAPTFSVTSRGVDIHIPHPRYMWRGLRYSVKRGLDMAGATLYPVPLWAVVFAASGLCVYVYQAPSGAPIHQNTVFVWMRYFDNIISPFNRFIRPDLIAPLIVVKATAIGVTAATVLHRFLLRQLLRYTGYMTESKPGLRTRLWTTVMSLFFTKREIRKTDIYEPCLPALPLPPLQGTVDKYMQSMRCIYSQESDLTDWHELRRAAESFLLNEGPALQRSLRLHHVVSPNYVEQWWTRHVFLSSRQSLCVTSNFYTVPFATYTPTNNPAARAAVLTYNLFLLKKKIADRTLQPNFGGPNNCAPLSMRQFFYAFNTVRVPGRELDSLEHDDSGDNHIVLLHRGRIYQVPVQNPKTRRPLTPHQLETLFANILNEAADEVGTGEEESGEEVDDSATPERSTTPASSAQQLLSPRSTKRRSYLLAESLLPALTTAPRAEWADIRAQYLLNDANNRYPLRAIERALFVVSFEDKATGRAAALREDHLETDCHQYLCGNGSNLWCDKSFNLVVRADGRVGAHVEHSWCEISTFATLLEYVVAVEEKASQYDDDGHAKRLPLDSKESVMKPPLQDLVTPKRLRFTLHRRLANAIRTAHSNFVAELGPATELQVRHYTRYGSNLPATLGVDADAWMQMALQLALYEDQGFVVSQIYESASQRAFARGRTEAARSVTEESCAFVRGVTGRDGKNAVLPEEKVLDTARRLELLKAACARHSVLLREAIAGFGADRHLFALYMTSVMNQAPSDFLGTFLRKTKWRVSSYHALQRRLPERFHPARDPRPYGTPAAGFGPAKEDGYGVSYCFCGEDSVYFTVTSLRSNSRTDARRLVDLLARALDTMAALTGVDTQELPTEPVTDRSFLDFSGELFGPGSPLKKKKTTPKPNWEAPEKSEEGGAAASSAPAS